MTSVTQTIDNYYAGMSQQPDMKKYPGQVKDIVNAVPDAKEGLYKRPGSKRIGSTPLAIVQSNGSWFHYFRDESEGSYIGQVASDGKVRIWSCTDGTEKDVWYHTDDWDELTDGIDLDIVRLISYEDLPEVFKRYIIYRSSVRAATQLVGNPQLAQLLAQQEALTRAAIMEYECNQGNHTMFGLPEDSTYNAYQPWRSLGR